MSVKVLFILTSLVVFTISCGLALGDCPSADLTGDCFVDFEDFALMANQWLTGESNISDDMVYIPYGIFEMGNHFSEGTNVELPLHPVMLDAFFMGRYEVTNAQYCAYLNAASGTGIYISDGVVYGTGNNQPYCDTSTSSSYSQIDYSGGVYRVRTKGGRSMLDDPMVVVSWYGAAGYCNWRSVAEGYEACYDLSTWECDFSKHGYRLPTEAEWEYAARGGLSGKRFPWSDPNISHSRANYRADPDSYPYDENPTSGCHPDWNDGFNPYTSPVGTFTANGYGLYDMAGNVYEWCNDWFDFGYYITSPYDNPTGPTSGSYRTLRGGSWVHSAWSCRVSHRLGNCDPDRRYYTVGFRIILDLE